MVGNVDVSGQRNSELSELGVGLQWLNCCPLDVGSVPTTSASEG